MSQHTRRQFIGSVGSAAVTTVARPGGTRRWSPRARGGAIATGRLAGRTLHLLRIPIGDLPQGNDPGPGSEDHHQPLQAGGSSLQGARPAGPEVLPGQRRRRARLHARTRERFGVGGSSRGCSSIARSATCPRPSLGPACPHRSSSRPVGRQKLAHADGELASAALPPPWSSHTSNRRAPATPSKRSPPPAVRDLAGTSSTGRLDGDLDASSLRARPSRRLYPSADHVPAPRPELEAAAA